MKTALVIDSSFYMPEKIIKDNNFKVIPLTVNFPQISYQELNYGGQNKELFERIKKNKTLPKTSQPTPQSVLDTYQELLDQGYQRIISLHISSKLSGTYQGIKIVADQFMEDNDAMKIEVYNTNTVAQVASIITLEIKQAIEQDVATPDEINNIIKHYSENTEIYILVDNLDYLLYGGRIPAALASVGNLFGIVPLLTLKNGEIDKVKNNRSKKKAIEYIFEQFDNVNQDRYQDLIFLGACTDEDKIIKKLYKNIINQSNKQVKEHPVTEFGIVLSTHLGPKTIALGWVDKYKSHKII